MAKITLSDLANLQNENTAVTLLNSNNTTLETALENTLSRDGTSPNQMSAVLDMNSHRILNLLSPVSSTEPVTVAYLNAAVADINLNSGATSTVSSAMQPVVAATTLPVAKGLLGLAGTAYAFDTRALAASSTIPASTTTITTLGYETAGDLGGALYTKTSGTTSGGFQSADGAWWQIADSVVNVKAFGAKGDAATNDTAAINLAIGYQGQYVDGPPNHLGIPGVWNVKTLYFPQGVYLITPGVLTTIYGSVYGPSATALASNNTDSAIFTIQYRDNGAQVASKSFIFGNIFGFDASSSPPWALRSGTGIMIQSVDQCLFDIRDIRGFTVGFYLNGGDYNLHQGTSTFNLCTVRNCGVGIKMNAGDNSIGSSSIGSFQEASKFNICTMADFDVAAIYLGGGIVPPTSPAEIVDNVFEIESIWPGNTGGDGIVCTTETIRNKFTVRSWDGGVTGSGKCIRSAGANNLFRVPWTDMSVYDSQGTDIWDFATNSVGVNGSSLAGESRSQLTGTTPPTTGKWRRGDIMWNNNPSASNPSGWMCVTSGTPGTWKAMANLAA